nr:hypothetical protein CFP56_09629 [Quercus suber]
MRDRDPLWRGGRSEGGRWGMGRGAHLEASEGSKVASPPFPRPRPALQAPSRNRGIYSRTRQHQGRECRPMRELVLVMPASGGRPCSPEAERDPTTCTVLGSNSWRYVHTVCGGRQRPARDEAAAEGETGGFLHSQPSTRREQPRAVSRISRPRPDPDRPSPPSTSPHVPSAA